MTTAMTPKQALEALQDGNLRFAANNQAHPNLTEAHRRKLRDGQNPIAVVFACSDSRVPVEIIFDAGLGDIFVVRTAGEILGESIQGTISYAVNSLGVPLVVVLGHEGCGAVAAATEALDGGKLPNDHQRVLIERVAPSILLARGRGKETAADYERVHAAETAQIIIDRMPRLKRKVEQGLVGVVAAHYQQETGEVKLIESHGV